MGVILNLGPRSVAWSVLNNWLWLGTGQLVLLLRFSLPLNLIVVVRNVVDMNLVPRSIARVTLVLGSRGWRIVYFLSSHESLLLLLRLLRHYGQLVTHGQLPLRYKVAHHRGWPVFLSCDCTASTWHELAVIWHETTGWMRNMRVLLTVSVWILRCNGGFFLLFRLNLRLFDLCVTQDGLDDGCFSFWDSWFDFWYVHSYIFNCVLKWFISCNLFFIHFIRLIISFLVSSLHKNLVFILRRSASFA
jgi:hypothetical protein